MTIVSFWTKYAGKGCFSSEAKKVKATIEFGISKLNLVPNFRRTDNVDFFSSNLQNILFLIEKRDSEQCHWIFNIRVSLETKFLLKLSIMHFWTKFAQKECFRCKTEKVNATLGFRIFQLGLVLNFNWNWQCWCFGPNLPKNSVSILKLKKWTPPLNFAYSNNSCC